MEYRITMETEWTTLYLFEDEKGISGLYFELPIDKKEVIERETPLLKQAVQQLKEYFDGKRKEFDLPLSMNGTDFQLKDWNALCTIPYGETRSYKQIAEQIGRPKAYRAVGSANHNNPISIIVPCHRVIGNNGTLVGYGGGLDLKTQLLKMEQTLHMI